MTGATGKSEGGIVLPSKQPSLSRGTLYSPKCLERLSGNSDRSPTGAAQSGDKRPRSAILDPVAPSMTAVEKPSDYFPDSLIEKLIGK
jgi:hypothetical protein